jgi:hypothetical protein
MQTHISCPKMAPDLHPVPQSKLVVAPGRDGASAALHLFDVPPRSMHSCLADQARGPARGLPCLKIGDRDENCER